MVGIPGMFRNFEELEESLTLAELNELMKAISRKESSDRKFAASLKGIDLKSPEEIEAEELRKQVERRVEAKRRGVSEDKLTLDEIGIEFS